MNTAPIPMPKVTVTLANGRTAKRTDTAPIPMPVGTNTLVNSRTINATDTAPIPMVPKVNGQGTNTLVNGRMTNTTDRVFITPTVAKRSNYDGSFNQDYEYKRGSGDLDECNGREYNGKYTYFATQTFPFFPRCHWGHIGRDFLKP